MRDRAIDAGEEIVRACVAAGGMISEEHGIGLENVTIWARSLTDLAAILKLRAVFDPAGESVQVDPTGASCGDIRHARRAIVAGAWI